MCETISTITENALPEEGVVVATLSEGGIQSELKRIGGLWFFPDGHMYVYYVPRYWKAL